MNRSRAVLFSILCCTAAVFLLHVTAASANAPPPPPYAWFRFATPQGVPMAPRSVQVLECQTSTCDLPEIAAHWDSSMQTTFQKLVFQPARGQLTCVNQACLFLPGSTFQSSNRDIKLKATFAAGDRLSPRFKLILEQFGSSPLSEKSTKKSPKSTTPTFKTSDLRVTVEDQALAIAPDLTVEPSNPFNQFGVAFALTQAVEIAIAAIYGWRRNLPAQVFKRLLGTVAFLNLLSFPVVWLFFPSWQPLQHNFVRVFGMVSLIVAIAVAALITLRPKAALTLPKLLFSWLIALVVMGIVGFFVAIGFSYGQWLPNLTGLPVQWTVIASELFAIGYEAWLLHPLNRSSLSLQQAGLLSLVMNTVSTLLGLLLFPANQWF